MNDRTKLTDNLAPLALLGVAIALAGCVPAYHCYSDSHINCRYCPPAPLPYTAYDTPVCHSSPAAKYLNGRPPVANRQAGDQPSSQGD